MRTLRLAFPLIAGTIVAIFAAIILVLTVLPAHAEDADDTGEFAAEVPWTPSSQFPVRPIGGCTEEILTVGNARTHDAGNVLGGIHVWTMRTWHQDCDGFDIIRRYTIRMEKESGRCGNEFNHVNNYDFNPNSLAGYNPGTQTIDCNSGQAVYTATWMSTDGWRVNVNDSKDERCIGAKIQVDKGPVKDDFNNTVPSVCFNGI